MILHNAILRVSNTAIFETEPGVLAAEASCLGLRPGVWPRELSLNGELFRFFRFEEHGGEIVQAVYFENGDQARKHLTIFND